jgi:hypothetical protein
VSEDRQSGPICGQCAPAVALLVPATIVVRGPFDDFRKIKFKVMDAGLNLTRLVVTYDNGAPDEIAVRESIPKGGESRQIDLRGAGKRSIRRIAFWYDTKGVLGGKANVTVFGMK